MKPSILPSALFFLAAFFFYGCGLFTRVETRYVKVTERTPCLKVPPDPLDEFEVSGPADGCPASFDACLAPAGYASLVKNYKAMIRRIQDDWDLCGVKE